MSSKDNDTFIKLSTKLADEQVRAEKSKRDKLSRITLEIEKILIREDFTMDDLGEIVAYFNARAQTVFAEMKISSIKNEYDRRSK